MTVTSRIPAVIDYLVTTFTASSTLGAATPPVKVYDGPQTIESSDPLVLWVGLDDPDAAGGRRAGDSQMSWAALGRQGKNEQLSIYCAADAWYGTDDIRTARVAAYGITAAVETLIQADATLGGTVVTPGNAIVTNTQLLQDNTNRGALARVTFEITAQARIGG